MSFDTALTALASVFIVGVVSAFVTTTWAGLIAAPHVATPKKFIRKALEMAGLKRGEKFYDLGAGNGHLLVMAAKEFGAEAVGLELSLYHYFLAKFNILKNNCSDKARVYWRNLYHENLRDADVVFLWLTPRAYRRLQKKFETELRPGARVVMFSSPLKFWEPTKTAEFGGSKRLFLYVVK